MIELNLKTQQDFLNREWLHKLIEAGYTDFSDASYAIIEDETGQYIIGKDEGYGGRDIYRNRMATYSISELYNKLCELLSRRRLHDEIICEGDSNPLIEALAVILIRYLKDDWV